MEFSDKDFQSSPSVDGNVCPGNYGGVGKPPLWLLATYLELSPQASIYIEDPNIIVVLLVADASNDIYLNKPENESFQIIIWQDGVLN